MTMVMGVRMVLLLLQSLGTSLLLFMALCLCFLAMLCFSTVAAPENIIFRQTNHAGIFIFTWRVPLAIRRFSCFCLWL